MDDLISRQAAADALILLQDHSDMPEDWHKGVSASLSCIYRVPSVPERKKGEWMFDDPISADFGCSECLHRQDYCTRYCPNCGALMWEEEEECEVCANADNEYCFACDNGNQFKPIAQEEGVKEP